jgi:hypothetical protein
MLRPHNSLVLSERLLTVAFRAAGDSVVLGVVEAELGRNEFEW